MNNHNNLEQGLGKETSISMISETFHINKKKKSITFKFADGKIRDDIGDLINVDGIDLSKHRKEPVAFFNHGKEIALSIGLCIDENGRYSLFLPKKETAR